MPKRKRLPSPPSKPARNWKNAWRLDSKDTIKGANLKFGLTLSGFHKLAFAPFVSFQLPKLARLAPYVILLRQPTTHHTSITLNVELYSPRSKKFCEK